MTEQPNENVLSGIRCPACGSYGPFDIHFSITATVTVSDDGYDLSEAAVTEDTMHALTNDVLCLECQYQGIMADFKEED